MNGDIVFQDYKSIEGEFTGGIWWIEGDDGSWDGPSNDWLTHRHNILDAVPEKGVVVQAGGNLGLYPFLLSLRFERVYTFEPHPLNFRCLMKNVDKCFNVFPVNAALAQHNKLCAMSMKFSSNMGMNRTVFDVPSEGDKWTPTFTIDQLGLEKCDLIWLDIEGAEPGAIEGAVETIRRFKPVIALETTNGWTDKFLAEQGYEHLGSSYADKVFKHRG